MLGEGEIALLAHTRSRMNTQKSTGPMTSVLIGEIATQSIEVILNMIFLSDLIVLRSKEKTMSKGRREVDNTGDHGDSNVGIGGVAISGYDGQSSSGSKGVSIAGDTGTAFSGDDGLSFAGDDCMAKSCSRGYAIAGKFGWAKTLENGTAISAAYGVSVTLDDGLSVAGAGGQVESGVNGAIMICYESKPGTSIQRWKLGHIGEDGLKPNTRYQLDENNEFVEVEGIS